MNHSKKEPPGIGKLLFKMICKMTVPAVRHAEISPVLDQIFHGADPLVVRIVGAVEALILTGHQPQEVGIVAGAPTVV